MLKRLGGVANGDLVATDARYHRKKNCLAHYIDSRKISKARGNEKNTSAYEKAIAELINEFSGPIVDKKDVFLLSTLKSRFQELVTEYGVEHPEVYTSQKLKNKLLQNWHEVIFISQIGISDLVCSKDISVGDALCKANELSSVLRDAELFLSSQDPKYNQQTIKMDESIVYAAVGILRRRMKHTQKLKDEYYSSTEMSLNYAKTFVDPLLYKMIVWLSDGKMYTSADEPLPTAINPKCVSMACDITTLCTAVMSPKHLGLAVHLYHDYGSRGLIEELHTLGYVISYTELRHFLTSAAIHVSTDKKPLASGALVPAELISKEDGGKLVIAAGDNWDHKEHTVDGKRTTHAMTSILVTQMQHEINFPRIKRSCNRTYDIQVLPGM